MDQEIPIKASNVAYVDCAPSEKRSASIRVVSNNGSSQIVIHYGSFSRAILLESAAVQEFIQLQEPIRLSIDHLGDDADVVLTVSKPGYVFQTTCPAEELFEFIEFDTEEEANLRELEIDVQNDKPTRPQQHCKSK